MSCRQCVVVVICIQSYDFQKRDFWDLLSGRKFISWRISLEIKRKKYDQVVQRKLYINLIYKTTKQQNTKQKERQKHQNK